MVVNYPWLGVALLVAAVIAGVWAWRLGLSMRRPLGLPLAHAGRIRALPRYRRLARRQLAWRVAEAVAVGVALLGAITLAARPMVARPASLHEANRDIVLCLDVSGSMQMIDAQVIDTYLDLAAHLKGERIGLTLFDTSAVTVFPLTDDADYIAVQLRATRDRLDGTVIPGTRVGEGTSLIGDGLASCVQRFDADDASRAKTIVLATDNQLAGTPLYTITQAAALAADARVMVFGLVSADNGTSATQQLAAALRTTGGDVYELTAANSARIEDAVKAQEAAVLASVGHRELTDLTWPGALVSAVGVLAAIVIAAVSRGRQDRARQMLRGRGDRG